MLSQSQKVQLCPELWYSDSQGNTQLYQQRCISQDQQRVTKDQ